MRTILFTLFLIVSWVSDLIAQDSCPMPRVKVSNDMDYYDSEQLSGNQHNILALNTTVANSIISQNAKDISFFSSFTSAVPVGEMDYYLTVESDPGASEVLISVKMLDNNNRIVLNAQNAIYDSIWVENTNSISQFISRKVSPLIDAIKEHQQRIRKTSMAAISSKFELDKRSYEVEVNETKKIAFKLIDCDGVVLPGRTIILELEGKGSIDKTTCTVDENGMGEFVYTAPGDNEQATVTLAHRYEDVAGNDNRFSVDAVKINTSGKLWLLVNYVSERAEIYIVGEHIGALEMNWNNENTLGGSIAAFSDDSDKEIWSSSLVGFIEMRVVKAGEDQWTASDSWFPGPVTITTRERGGYEIEILWPMEDGTSLPVKGTITYEKPESFDQARKKYLAANRGS